MAYGQTPDQPCSQSQPCHKICGDHTCAPGETFTLSANQTTTVKTSANSTSTNQTANSVTANMGITTNATATKNPSNMTMTTNATTNTSTNMTVTSNPKTNATVTTSVNMTATTSAPTMMMPREQIASGTQPKDVKCESGFELVINQFNPRPACVKSNIASLLVERGWGMLVSGSP